MKKVALSLLAFALVGAMAFGQDVPPVKFSGYVNTGLVATNSSNGTTFWTRANDYGADGVVIKFAADLAASNFGYHIALNHKSSIGTGGLDCAWAWVSPVEGLTVVASSAGSNAPFDDLDDNGAGNYTDTALGAWYTTGGLSLGAQITPVVSGTAPNTSNVTTAFPVWFAARYALDKVVTLNAYGSNGVTNKLDTFSLSGAVGAIPSLTLTAGYNGRALSDPSTANSFFDVALGYQLTDAFYAGVVVYDRNLSGIQSQNTGSSYINYKPNVSYVITPQLKLSAYLIGDTTSSPNYEPQAKLTFTPVPGATINASVWYDTNTAGPGYNNYNIAVAGATSGSAQTSAYIETIFSF